MSSRKLIALLSLGLFTAVTFAADKKPESWDGLVEVKAKRMDVAYLAPGADFRPYTKLMVDPTEAAFHKDWMENMNDRRDLSRRVSADQAADILEAAKSNFADVFTDVFSKAGYTIVDAPGPDVLRVTPGVINLYINAPDVMAGGRSTSYTANAGEASMVLELRDSQSGALLGRMIDREETREMAGMQQASRVSNKADFRMLFNSWAKICVKGLETLKQASPMPAALTPGQKVN